MDGQDSPNSVKVNFNTNNRMGQQPALNNAQPESNSQVVFDNSKGQKSNKILVGVICGVVGVAVGAAGYFGITKFLDNQKTPDCECNCEEVVADVSNDSDFSFLKLETAEQNLIYSPLSIKNGLSLLNAGAAGSTKSQIENVLGNNELTKYNNIPDVLSLANSIFIRDTFKNDVLEDYVNTVSQDYNAEVNYDSFANGSVIDSWVNNKTFGLINNLGLEPTEKTEMVLVNALAIQMDWKLKFDKAFPGDFYKSNDEEISVDTLRETTSSDAFSYYIDDNTTALAMDLAPTSDNTELQFVAIMPNGNLTDYVKDANTSSVNKIIEQMKPASEPKDGIYAQIPKFKFDYELNFKNDLQSLGVANAFSDSADFSNMATKPLKVNNAIHKANIEFSEDGIKAAAVTAFEMYDAAALADEETPQPIDVIIDHPFLFIIRDKSTGEFWFIGTVYNPGE